MPMNMKMRYNKLVKLLLGATLHADRYALMKLCVTTWGIPPTIPTQLPRPTPISLSFQITLVHTHFSPLSFVQLRDDLGYLAK